MKRGAAKFVARYQSFAEVGGPAHGASRVAALRAELAARGLAGFVVPRADEHQNEYVPPGAERLLWLTGFSGSAGLAIVLADKAALFVDGRYTLQAPAQVDGSVFAVKHVVNEPPSAWIEAQSRARAAGSATIPGCTRRTAVERLAKACRAAGGELVAVETNPIDAIWTDRPAPPLGADPRPSRARSPASARRPSSTRVGEALKGADGLLVSDAHTVAWLFNIRGGDVAHTPLPLAFAYAPRDGRPTLFVDGAEADGGDRARGSAASPTSRRRRRWFAFVAALGAAGARVVFDAATAPARLVQALEAAGGKAIVKADPIALMKAVKNAVELAGTRAAHLRDGAALSRFLAWFDAEAPKGGLTEIDAAEALETFRRETGALKDVSFPTIAGRRPARGDRPLPGQRGVESRDRPRAVPHRQRRPVRGRHHRHHPHDRASAGRAPRCATASPACSRAISPSPARSFRAGRPAAQLDTLAREALWRAGLDFDHGTGHGVGVYLSVHEGPQRMSKTGFDRARARHDPVQRARLLRGGAFGIRIENLVVVREVERSPAPTGRRSASRRSRSRRSICGWSKRS